MGSRQGTTPTVRLWYISPVPLISVVIPSFNYARYVGQAIESVLSQTFTDFELTVIDDGSRDETRAVVTRYTDSRLRYVYQENSGLSATRNNGFAMTSGEFIAYLDADDLWLPHKLERQVERVKDDPGVGLVSGGYYLQDEETGARTERRSVLEGNVLHRVAIENVVAGSATTSLLRRSVLERTGLFDTTLRACEDWDLWLRVARVTRFAYVDEPIAVLRRHRTNMSSESMRMRLCLTRVLDRFYRSPDLPPDIRRLEPRARAVAHLTMAKLAVRLGHRREAVADLARAIWLQPSWPDPYLVLSSVVVKGHR